MGLRHEAWTLPWDPAGFKRKVAIVPVVEGTGQGSVGFLAGPEEGSMDVALGSWDRLDEIISDTESSLIRVFDCDPDGTNTVIHEWMAERVSRNHNDSRTVSISGGNLFTAWERTLVYPWDYPKNPTVQDDHIWGGENDDGGGLIENSGFEQEAFPNGGLEDGNTGHWQGTEDNDDYLSDGQIVAINSSVDARTGNWYGQVNPAGQGGGVRRSISGLTRGDTYVITGFVNEPTGAGDRIRAAVIGAQSASHTNAYEEHDIFWAEVGNAAQGAGSTNGTWQQISLAFVAGSDSIEVLVIYDDVNDLNFHVDDWSINGETVGIDPWYAIRNINTIGNRLDVLRVSNTQSHSGSFSLNMNGVDGPHFDAFGRIAYGTIGAGQNLRLVVGRLYTMTAWVRHDGTGDNGVNELMRIIIARRTPKGNIRETITGEFAPAPGSYHMANKTVSVPSNTWTKIQMTFVADVAEVSAQVRYAGTNRNTNVGTFDSPNIFWDDVSVHEGLPATTIGDIWTRLLDDAAVNHLGDDRGPALDWVDYSSFDASLDSNGAPWNETEVAFIARAGGSYIHVLDDTFNLGYEAELVPKAVPVGGFTHDFHVYNPLGRDSSPSTAINILQPISDGDALRRIPQYTALMVRSPDGEFTEEQDATLVANFGRFETFRSDSEASSPTTRQLLIDNLFTFEEANRRAVRFSVFEAPGVPRPFIDYRPGDTIPMSLPPGLDKEPRRVQRLDYANTMPTQYVVVGSRILDGEAAAFDLVRRMWRRLNRPDGLKDKSAPSLMDGGAGYLFDVAASNAPDWEKALSRRICDGVDDHVEINAAIDDIFNLSDGQAVLQLSSGTFNVSVGQIFVISSVHMRGTGKFSTLFHNQDLGVGSDTPQSGDFLIFVQQDGELSDLGFSTTFSGSGGPYLGTCVVSEYAIIHDIHHFGGDAHIFVYYHGTIYPSHDLSSWANYAKSMLLYNENWVDHHGIFHSGEGTTLWFDVQAWGSGTISNVHIDSTGAHAIVLEEVGNLNITGLNVATGNPFTPNDWAVFHLLGTPGNLSLSDINVESVGYLVWAGTGEGTFGGVSIAHVTGKIWHSVVDVPGGTVGGVLSSAFVLRHVDLECGDSDGINLVIGSGEVDLSDLHLTAIEGVGINLVRQSTAIPVSQVRIHDVTLDADQHGVLADGVELHLSKAQITAGAGAGNTYDAVHLTGEMERPVIEHNNILSASQLRYGINIASPAVVRAIVVGNSGDDPGDFGTDAINDQGTDTQLAYPADATYGDNFFRSGSTSGADQIEPVVPPTTFPNREFESARPVIPVQS